MQKYKLSDVAIINPKDKINDLSISVSFVPMQNVSETGNIDVSEIRQALEVSKGFTSFIDGDVLMAKITPCMENGKGAVAAGLCNGRGFGSTEFFVIRPDHSRVRSEWIYYYTVQKRFRLDCERNMTGSAGQKRVPKAYLENSEIGIPSLTEQDHVLSKLRQAKKIIILRQQQLQKLDELVKARFVELFGDPISNSHALPEATLPELGEFGRGVSKHRPRNDPKLLGGEYPLIQTGDVAAANLYITTYNSTYSELGLKQSKMWKKGTLCITIAANIAKTAILDFDACFPDSVVGFLANEKTNNVFIHYWFSFFQEILESQAPESAQKNINLKILSELKVIVPEKAKQDKFVKFVQQVSKSKTAIQKALDKTQLLFDSLMQKYFG